MTLYTLDDLSLESKKKLSYLVEKSIAIIGTGFYFSNYKPFLILYKQFIEAFHLKAHAKNVIDYFLSSYESEGVLHVASEPMYAFSTIEGLEKFYEEDMMVFDKGGTLEFSDPMSVEFARVLFAKRKNKNALQKLWDYTFFAPKTKEGETFDPESFKGIPSEYLELSEKIIYTDFLASAFNLSHAEARVLETVFLFSSVEICSDILDSINKTISPLDTHEQVKFFAGILGETVNWLRNLLNTKGHLFAYGLLDANCAISSDIMNGIYAGSLEEYFADVLSKDDNEEVYPLESFEIEEKERNLAVGLLKSDKPANILIYGSVGTGKTEFAKTLAKESGLDVYFYSNDVEIDLHDKNSESFTLSKLNSVLAIERKDSVLIIDEAESILNTQTLDSRESSSKKGSVNKMLENSKNKVIWVLNYIDPLDESTKRRFNYAIRFKEMSQDQIKNIARSKFEPLKISSGLSDEIVSLCAKYRVTGYSVENIVRLLCSKNISGKSDEEILDYVKLMLESNSSLLFGIPKKRNSLAPHYKPALLNASLSPDELLGMIQNSISYEKKCRNERFGIRVLLHGIEGSGKRELVKYIAQGLNRVTISLNFMSIFNDQFFPSVLNDVLASAFMSEKIVILENLDNVFDGDTKIPPEMLSAFFEVLSEYKGIVFCTTSFKEISNTKLEKYFHISVSFDALDSGKIKSALNEYFAFANFTDEQIARLQEYESLCFSDFNSVTDIIRFYPEEKITSGFIVDELIKLQKNKSSVRRMGFLD